MRKMILPLKLLLHRVKDVRDGMTPDPARLMGSPPSQ